MKLKRRIGYFFNDSLFNVNTVTTFELELKRFNQDKNKPLGCVAIGCITKKGTKQIVAVNCNYGEEVHHHSVLNGRVLWNEKINDTNLEYLETYGVEVFLTALHE